MTDLLTRNKKPNICAVGLEETGKLMVKNLAQENSLFSCITIWRNTNSFTFCEELVELPQRSDDDLADIVSLGETVKMADMVFILASLAEITEADLIEVSQEIRSRSVPAILVVPENYDNRGQLIPFSDNIDLLKVIFDGLLILSLHSLSEVEGAMKYQADAMMKGSVTLLVLAGLSQSATQHSNQENYFADIFQCVKGRLTKVGIGISNAGTVVNAAEKALRAMEKQKIVIGEKAILLCSVSRANPLTANDCNSVYEHLYARFPAVDDIVVKSFTDKDLGISVCVCIYVCGVQSNPPIFKLPPLPKWVLCSQELNPRIPAYVRKKEWQEDESA